MKRLALATLALTLLAPGCVVVHERDRDDDPVRDAKGGPPPWAPAHGYRRHHDEAEAPDLVFDEEIGVYVVVGYPDVYFDDDHYFQRVHSHWERCHDLEEGRWQEVEEREVPERLVAHYAKKAKAHRHEHESEDEHAPAKHEDD